MTEPAVRRIPPDRFDDYQRIVDYAFNPEDGPPTADDADELADKPGERFGVFVGEELQSVCKHYDFEARLRGSWVPLAGLAAVATPPEHRHRGHVRRLITDALERWRGEYPLAALWPFDRAFYRQFGWATANAKTTYTCSPEELPDSGEPDAGRLRRVTAEDWGILQDAHEAHAESRTLTLRRDEAWWREKVFRVSDDDRPFVYAYEADGDVRGYVVYSLERTGDGMDDRRIDVDDLAFADHAAYRRLLGFLAGHDSQAGAVRFTREEGSDLLDLVADPSGVHCEVRPGPMVRVVDVEGALSAMPVPTDASADLTIAVADETASWNDDVVRVTIAGGDVTVASVEADAADADVQLPVGTLSQLVVGYRDAGTLRRTGDLAVADESVATALEDVFPAETVFLRQFF